MPVTRLRPAPRPVSPWHEFIINGVRYAEPDPEGLEELRQNDERRVALATALGGENACPPEDVGGPPGYEDFLAAIADSRHEEHENFLAWCGGSFDPAWFDQEAVNRALLKIKS